MRSAIEAPLRLGIVGLGRAAAQMLPSIAAHPSFIVAAGADPNPDACARFTADFGAPAFADIESLCERGDVDAVYVATPHQLHAGDVAVAATHGKHAIVEKPMALTLEDCRAMTSVAERHRVVLLVGPTHGMDPAVERMHEIVASGTLGRLRMIVSLNYGDFLYRARRPEELSTARGGGIVYNQIPHQIEMARALDRGPLRSVRAVAGTWDARRPTEGAMTALLEFEDGVAASLTYSGYDHFDSDELHWWIGEFGNEKHVGNHGASRRALRAVHDAEAESRLKAASGFAGRGVTRLAGGAEHQPHFGFLLVSCEGGDMRPSADGVLVYGDDGVRELPLEHGRAYPNKERVLDELYDAVAHGVPPLHDGAWGTETVAATLALLESSRERREVVLETAVARG
ncbi:MAG: phthalate 4,5-cis-dihydrodiol dehydrogenase [Candidatus Eremiobacteraeota bacterium]|jgi:phthalate 4,5-cis-dihydrodiol dehydrogenase|nr:phthalate 4,5-cis-dihydrodiol dehydrogenase [Candidatus Eremiobacteraeota bacterium]